MMKILGKSVSQAVLVSSDLSNLLAKVQGGGMKLLKRL